VAAQVRAVSETDVVATARVRGQSLIVHGWIYDLHDGLLRDLDLSASGTAASAL
jgi:carbonic anhydrase